MGQGRNLERCFGRNVLGLCQSGARWNVVVVMGTSGAYDEAFALSGEVFEIAVDTGALRGTGYPEENLAQEKN